MLLSAWWSTGRDVFIFLVRIDSSFPWHSTGHYKTKSREYSTIPCTNFSLIQIPREGGSFTQTCWIHRKGTRWDGHRNTFYVVVVAAKLCHPFYIILIWFLRPYVSFRYHCNIFSPVFNISLHPRRSSSFGTYLRCSWKIHRGQTEQFWFPTYVPRQTIPSWAQATVIVCPK